MPLAIRQFINVFLVVLFVPFNAFGQSEDFPGRSIYPNVEIYQTKKLNAGFNNAIIIDVRSNYEFDTLHIKNAVNIPLNSKDFVKQVEALNAGRKPIVFYCNGHSCYKSYKAVQKAQKAGIANVFSYDSGIFDWANAYPDKSTMLGFSPVDPEKLISEEKLQQHMLEPKEFSAQITENTVILDIREPAQRGLIELYPYRQENISLVEKDKLVAFLAKILEYGKPLLVYDESGTQVPWLQYYLEAKGIKKYYFLQGGIKQFLKEAKN